MDDTEITGNGSKGEDKKAAGFFHRIHGDWVEIFAAVLLALATVASAWSAYQATRWSSVESRRFSETYADRVEAAEYADLAEQELAIDADMFTAYAGAYFRGDLEAAHYFETTLFRNEMKVAVEAWKATDPMNNPYSPETPFDMPEYKNKNKEKSKKLESSAQKKTIEATEAIEHSDHYVLLTVLFAMILFFAGISTKFKTPSIRIVVLSMGALVFIGSVIVLTLQPVY